MICANCNKDCPENIWNSNTCSNLYHYPVCDYCEKEFCSEECAKIEHYEDTFPNCCPGTYWCHLCRNGYLDAAKGHLFLIKNHEETPDLLKYGGDRCKGGAFMEMCMKCNMWSYEFKSFTDIPGTHEGQPCGELIRSFAEVDREPFIKNPKPMKTVYILFGEMGGGKNYHGEKLSMNMGIEFLDGDSLVPEEMAERVSNFKPLSPEMVEDYVTNHLAPAILNRANVIVAQALYMDKHRLFLRDFLETHGYQVVFYWVKPKFWNNLKQIYSRPKGLKWALYWLMNKPFFQKPSHDHQVF